MWVGAGQRFAGCSTVGKGLVSSALLPLSANIPGRAGNVRSRHARPWGGQLETQAFSKGEEGATALAPRRHLHLQAEERRRRRGSWWWWSQLKRRPRDPCSQGRALASCPLHCWRCPSINSFEVSALRPYSPRIPKLWFLTPPGEPSGWLVGGLIELCLASRETQSE